MPTDNLTIILRAVYIDYTLMHNSWLLLRWRYRRSFDPFTGSIICGRIISRTLKNNVKIMCYLKIKRLFDEICEDVDVDTPKALKPSQSKMVFMMLSFIVTVVLYVLCCSQKGVFFSGIYYSGHGPLGWICLWITCYCMSSLYCSFMLWFLGLTPQRKPRWGLFATGMAFFVLFVGGLSRHVPKPIIGELLIGSSAALLIYCSLFKLHKSATD